ncbi:MAG: hypothetical protein AAB815_03235 [Patescibacteria group bacterium]
MLEKTAKKTTKICSACGTSIVNHRFIFISNLLEEIIGNVGDKFFNFTSIDKWQKTAFFVEKIFYALFSLLGIVRYSSDVEKALTGRSKLIWEEAQRRSIPMEQIVIWGKYIDHYRARINEKKFYFQSLPIPPWLTQEGYKWLDDKFILFKKLSSKKIPVPRAVKILTLKSARNTFETLHKPVIVKPKFGSRGRHTTTNINTERELVDAFSLAREITPWITIQEHLSGSVYRATVINNELVGFFRADPPQVTGDNARTIRELIVKQNDVRHERLSEILINDDMINFIKRQGYNLESVPPDGAVVDLSAKTGRMYGGYTKEMLSEVHPKMHAIFEKAGEIVQAPVVGFDLIIADPTKDPDRQHWGIIECNSLPFIDLHYFALEGPQINLAKNIWDLWDTGNNQKSSA